MIYGLQINTLSKVFCAGEFAGPKNQILDALHFKEGISVRYLGKPLVPSRLSYHDFRLLIEKITRRINAWTCKYLSFAGRLKLLQLFLYGVSLGSE